ncbi:uncharacterized protein [Diabrotica undecimpunctata]|uniref:uncharacterized protein isoform X1 n=1 Tax=Diabrotica undecimpunctata TaxID=50387 RepID=UPI003B6357E0
MMNSSTVFKTKRICHRHFEDKFVSSWSHKLYKNAIPSLHLYDSSSNVHPRSISMLCVEANVTKIKSPSTSRDAQSTHMFQSFEIPHCIAEHNDAQLPNEEILIQTDESKDLKGVALKNITPLKILQQCNISRGTITPKKKKIYAALKQLHHKYSLERNSKKSFQRRLFEAEEFYKENKLGDLQNVKQKSLDDLLLMRNVWLCLYTNKVLVHIVFFPIYLSYPVNQH